MSPSVTSDNEQEWYTVENNKRIRSLNNIVSPRTKKSKRAVKFLLTKPLFSTRHQRK